jgi:hypothetical protein
VRALLRANNLTSRGATVNHSTVSDVARRYGVPPRTISDLFYARRLDDRLCPIIGGRRMIPLDYLPVVETVLREMGRLRAVEVAADA